jgi:hypothetical protein
MAPTPRASINDDFIANMSCSICGKESLLVHHTTSLPDYVSCRNCQSAFIVEAEGSRVLYGKINDQYPRTQQFAQKQWMELEAVGQYAAAERMDEEKAAEEAPASQAPAPQAPAAQAPSVPDTPKPTPMPEPPPAEDILRSAAVPIPTEPDLGWPPNKVIRLDPEPEADQAPEPPQPDLAEPTPPPPAGMEPEPLQPDRVEPTPAPSVSEEPEIPKPVEITPSAQVTPPIPAEPEMPAGVGLGEIGLAEEKIEEKEPLIETPVFPQGMKLEQAAEKQIAKPTPEIAPKSADLPGMPPLPPAETPPEPAVQAPAARPTPEPAKLELRENDPPQGIRHRVVIRGEKVIFPTKICAHCTGTPVRGRLTILGDLPQGQKIGQRKKSTFNLPLCAECHDRARNISPEEKAERLQAHLLAALTAMVLLVAALAWGLDIQENPVSSVTIIFVLALIGYSLPAYILLGRIKPSPPSPNAGYIRSTLLIPEDAQGLETAFEFRNKEYADQFSQANDIFALGKPVQVKDRAFSKPRPTEPPA